MNETPCRTGQSGKLCAGFGRADISPVLPTPLGGYGQSQNRLHTVLLDPLYATCIAFTDGDETILLFTVDAVRSHGPWTDGVRSAITATYGIPAGNVQIVSTHSHSAPDTLSNLPVVAETYARIYRDGLLAAAKQAMEDRCEVSLYCGSVTTDHLTFVRHIRMNDGTVAGPNFGRWASGVKDYVVENDPQLLLVKLERKVAGKKDILMMNFQAHATLTGGFDKTDVSADYIGVCRQRLEAETGMHFAFFLGACGNQTPNSFIPADNEIMPCADRLPDTERNVVNYGTALAYYALELLPNLAPLPGTGIQTTSRTVTAKTKKNSGPARLADAQAVIDEWKATDRSAGNRLARQLGFDSVYEASAMLGWDRLPESQEIIVHATRIGGLNFVNVPYEMFSPNSLYIKEKSPGAFTMVFTQSNQAWGYITDRKAHEYKCYENFGGNFAPGSGELLAENAVQILEEIQK